MAGAHGSEGDQEAGGLILEYRRFTLEEVRAGEALGWTFSSGWFSFSQSVWAWFRREVSSNG